MTSILVMEQIKLAFQQCELDYLDAIEALQKECGLSGREAEAFVEIWDDEEIASTVSQAERGSE